jgi:uncharacterized metal-binding protein
MKNEKKIMLLLTIGIAAAGVVLFGIYAMWWGLDITVQASTVSNVLAPLLLVAGFIERAVEVVITPWRDPEADKRQAAIDNAKTDKNLALQKTATDSLNENVGETTRYAFIVALMFGLVAAMVGMRALWPFLETNQHLITAFNGRPTAQKNTFIVFDVVLSAALMAGGANGVHSVMSAFTSFFDASAQTSQNKAKAQSQGAAQS